MRTIKVNNKEIKIYELDNTESILIRVSAQFKTIPNFLYFPEGKLEELLATQQTDFKVENLLNVIKKDNSDDFDIFYSKNEKKFDQNETSDIKYIFQIWLVYNEGINKIIRENEFFLQSASSELVEIDNIQNIWTNREIIKNRLEQQINEQIIINNKNVEIFEQLEENDGKVLDEEIDIERSFFQLYLNTGDYTILELFNMLELNRQVPFATSKNFYKIYKEYIPNDEWIDSKNIEENTMKIFVNTKKNIDASHRDYIPVEIKTDDSVTLINSVINTGNNFLSQQEFIQRCMSVLKTDFQQIKTEETNIVGVFYYPMTLINSYVFSDLVLNDNVFSSLIVIDESVKATKKRSDTSQSWLYIHFNHPITGHVTASIIQKKVDRSDINMKKKSIDIYEQNTPYVRVRAKAQNYNSLKIFRDIFQKLLNVYETKEEEIIKEYQKYIPDFKTREKEDVPMKKTEVSLIAPELFVPQYSRSCPKLPSIVDEKELEDYKNFLKFPRDEQNDENTYKYKSDGLNQHFYVCKHEDYPYIYLKQNNLSNKNIFPYIPCCAKNDNNNPEIYQEYYHNVKIEQKTKKQQDIITTNKILSKNTYGYLPKTLQLFFKLLDTTENIEFLRYGVSRTKSSFLECILSAKNMQKEINVLEKIRKKLAKTSSVGKQCMYDKTIDEISELIKNTDVYLNPVLFIQILEYVFECNIILFSSESIILPRHIEGYYKFKSEYPLIMIYEHLGSESDRAEFPQCEIITRWNKKTKSNTEFIFDNDSKINKYINNVFNSINNTYVLNKKLTPIIFDIKLDNIKFISQKIDSYGKTRQINLTFENDYVTIFTDPIPPLNLPLDNKVYKTKINIANNIMTITSQTVNDGKVTELQGIIGNVNVSIPIKDGKPLSIEIKENKQYIGKNESVLEIYNNNKKTARYITEYFYWLFSNYAKENKEITDKTIINFLKKNVQIIENFEYKNIARNFSKNSSCMINGKLVVTSEEMIKRLVYMLRLELIQNRKKIETFKDKTAISDYYLDITDFDHKSFQIILEGEDAVNKWIHENRNVFILHSSIQPVYTIPYFFKNKLIKNEIFLAQNVSNLENAIGTAVEWHKKGYNNIKNISKKYKFTLYSYKNENNITQHTISGEDSEDSNIPINIIGYKIGDTSLYTVLLKLN